MKTINENDFQIVINVKKVDGAWKVTSSIHYEVSSEGISQRRGSDFTLSATKLTAVKDIVADVLKQKKVEEGIS